MPSRRCRGCVVCVVGVAIDNRTVGSLQRSCDEEHLTRYLLFEATPSAPPQYPRLQRPAPPLGHWGLAAHSTLTHARRTRPHPPYPRATAGIIRQGRRQEEAAQVGEEAQRARGQGGQWREKAAQAEKSGIGLGVVLVCSCLPMNLVPVVCVCVCSIPAHPVNRFGSPRAHGLS